MQEKETIAGEVYLFPNALPGFEELHQFWLVRDEEAPLAQLVSVENKEIGFILIRPETFLDDYEFAFDEESEEVLNLEEEGTVLEVWNILTLNTDVAKTTTNLQAPVCLNVTQKIGLQIIVNDEKYSLRYPLVKNGSESEQTEGEVG